MPVLTNWDFHRKYGNVYVTGDLDGREWITSHVTSMYETESCYVVHTLNSVYYLYY
jgi:hypothetical protein